MSDLGCSTRNTSVNFDPSNLENFQAPSVDPLPRSDMNLCELSQSPTRGRGRGAGSLAVARGGTRAGTMVTELEGTEPQVVGVSQEEPAEVVSLTNLQATVDRLVEEALRNRPREPAADGHFPGM